MTNLRIHKCGRIDIVSSGYEDRFAMSTTWVIFEKNDIRYRIDGDNFQHIAAYVELAGIQADTVTAEKYAEIAEKIHSIPWKMSATYRDGFTTGSITTTPDRINAGIKMATGFTGLNEVGISRATEIANTLSHNEWLVIRTGLEKINKLHTEIGKPVVCFTIPDEKQS